MIWSVYPERSQGMFSQQDQRRLCLGDVNNAAFLCQTFLPFSWCSLFCVCTLACSATVVLVASSDSSFKCVSAKLLTNPGTDVCKWSTVFLPIEFRRHLDQGCLASWGHWGPKTFQMGVKHHNHHETCHQWHEITIYSFSDNLLFLNNWC